MISLPEKTRRLGLKQPPMSHGCPVLPGTPCNTGSVLAPAPAVLRGRVWLPAEQMGREDGADHVAGSDLVCLSQELVSARAVLTLPAQLSISGGILCLPRIL